MANAVTPNDAPRRDPDPRGPFGNARPSEDKTKGKGQGNLPREKVEDRLDMDSVKPEDYQPNDRAPEALLFDIDGTLIDSNGFHVRAWSEAFQEAGHHVDPIAIHSQIGKGGDKLVPALLPDTNEQEQKALSARHGAIFKAKYLLQAKPFAGATELLRRSRADGRKVVLASSAKKEELDNYVAMLGVADVIDATTSIDDVNQSKPAPDIFETALKKAGTSADRAIVIGDTVWDAEAARRVGARMIGLRSGGVKDEALQEAGAIDIYDDVAALLADYDRSPLATSGPV